MQSGREDIFTVEADKETGEFALAETSSASSRCLDSLEKERKTIVGTYLSLCALNEIVFNNANPFSMAALRCVYYVYPHLTDEKSEAQRREETCPKINKRRGRDLHVPVRP